MSEDDEIEAEAVSAAPGSDPTGKALDSQTQTELMAAHIAELIGLEPPKFVRDVITQDVGRPAEQTRRWWRATGLVEVPDDAAAFGEHDREMAANLARLLAAQPDAEAHILRVARILGSSFSRIADAEMELMEWLVVQTGASLDDADSRIELVQDPRVRDLIQLYEDATLFVWRRHLFASMGRWLRADEDDDIQVVGFVDIAGFSSMSREVEADELTEIVETFEQAAMDQISLNDSRIVKFVGDGVMYISDTVADAIDIALSLQEVMDEQDPKIWLHSGVVEGPVVSIGGDVFGNTVNLASRLAETARRGRVLVPTDQVGELEDREDLQIQRVRRMFELKGVGRMRLSSVGRLSTERIQENRQKAEWERQMRELGQQRSDEKVRKKGEAKRADTKKAEAKRSDGNKKGDTKKAEAKKGDTKDAGGEKVTGKKGGGEKVGAKKGEGKKK